MIVVRELAANADVHVEGDAHVGVAGHPGHVGGIQAPGEQGGSAEHVPQAVPDPLSAASLVPPPGGRIGALEDVAVEVGGPPQLPVWGREEQPQQVAAEVLLRAGLLDAGGEPLGQRVAGRGETRVDGLPPLAVLRRLDVQVPGDLGHLPVDADHPRGGIDLSHGEGGDLAPAQPAVGSDIRH